MDTFSKLVYLIETYEKAQQFIVILNKHKLNLVCYEIRKWKT